MWIWDFWVVYPCHVLALTYQPIREYPSNHSAWQHCCWYDSILLCAGILIHCIPLLVCQIILFDGYLTISLINILYTGWWFQPLWKLWKSVEVNIPNTWKNRNRFQTINQIYMRTKVFNDWITMSDSNISTLDRETTIALPWTRPPRPAGWISWHRTCRSPAN